MKITVSRTIDPLTRRDGFSANARNDCAFAFTEREAVAKLLLRLDCAATVEWLNGSVTLFHAPRGKGVA